MLLQGNFLLFWGVEATLCSWCVGFSLWWLLLWSSRVHRLESASSVVVVYGVFQDRD